MGAGGILLGPDGKLGGQQTLRLVLCDVGPVDHIADELRPKRQYKIVAVDHAGLLRVNDEEVVALLADGDVGVLAGLHVAVCAENEEAAVAPGAEAVWSEPVQPHIPEAVVAAQHHVAEVLEVRMFWVAYISHLRSDDFRFGAACIEEELIELVRADVAKNAAVLHVIPEPIRPAAIGAGAAHGAAGFLDDLVWGNVDGLDDSADGAILDQVAGLYGGFYLQTLG